MWREENKIMALKRVILEMGTGNDLHGGNYTKAAIRAVQTRSITVSLSMIRSLGVDSKTMRVEVTIGVQQPDKVDIEAVAKTLPARSRHGESGAGRAGRSGSGRRDVAIIASARSRCGSICRNGRGAIIVGAGRCLTPVTGTVSCPHDNRCH